MKNFIIILLVALPFISFADGSRWIKAYKVKYIYKTHTKSGNILSDTSYIVEGQDSIMFTWLKTDTLTYIKTRWDNVNNHHIEPVKVPLIGSGNHPVTVYRKINYVGK